MNKRLSKYGNSLALVIDKPILELLNIKEDTVLKITTDGTRITISPIVESQSNILNISDNKQMQECLESTMQEYAPALKKLADN